MAEAADCRVEGGQVREKISLILDQGPTEAEEARAARSGRRRPHGHWTASVARALIPRTLEPGACLLV